MISSEYNYLYNKIYFFFRYYIIQYEQINARRSPPPPPIGRTEIAFRTAVNSGFDQIFKGDVIIKKLKNKHEYRITFSKVYGDRFLFYQVFNKDNTDNVNDKRFAAYIPIKNIINMYNMYNANSRFINKLVFTPTTIMELPNFSKYAFVINKAYFNSHKRLVFMISTKEINIRNTSSSKKLIQIPCGKFKHVRFDVDDFDPYAVENTYIDGLWEYIKSECGASTTKSDTYDADNFNNGTVKLKLCDITMPTSPPEACKGVSLNPFRTGRYIPYLKGDTECFTNLTKMVDDNLLPEVFTYILTKSDLGCGKGVGSITPSFLFFSFKSSINPTQIGDVIEIYISQDNYNLDLSEYVVANSSYKRCGNCPMIIVKQIYEISENTTNDNVTLNGSILTIKNKNIPGSCTLTVRQKYINNLEISIKLQWKLFLLS